MWRKVAAFDKVVVAIVINRASCIGRIVERLYQDDDESESIGAKAFVIELIRGVFCGPWRIKAPQISIRAYI